MASMVAMKIGLVHPPLKSFASGGNVYNGKLLEYAARCGFPVVSLPWLGRTVPGENWDLLVWDSLLLDSLARLGEERIALLLHYLPSLEPALDLRTRQAFQALECHAVAQADFALVTGQTVAKVLTTRWPGKPVFLCEPGVSEVFSRDRARPADQTVTLLTVAHLLPGKGHRQLLEILAQLRHLNWNWQVAGDGDRSPETSRRLRDRAARSGLTGRITFHGALQPEAIAALMAKSDLLVSPSTFEAYGMAVAEAAATGLPVLSNRVGASEQLIQHGVTGFLATAGDWDGFGRYLNLLMQDAALRAAFRNNLRRCAVRGWDQTLADFRSACESMLG